MRNRIQTILPPNHNRIPAGWVKICRENFRKARKKHPYFVAVVTCQPKGQIDNWLERVRAVNDNPEYSQAFDLVISEELNEIYSAWLKGDYEEAEAECFDAIALLLRLVAAIRYAKGIAEESKNYTKKEG